MNHAALILASGSPRRRELLSLTGLPYVVDAPEVDESCALPPEEAVQEISRRKGLAGAAAHPGCVVLSADTLVAVDGKALGKPHSEEEAFQMLSLLSGRWHQVYTGVRRGCAGHGSSAGRGDAGAFLSDDGGGNPPLYRHGRTDGQGGRVCGAGHCWAVD